MERNHPHQPEGGEQQPDELEQLTRPEHREYDRRHKPRIYVACLASYNNGVLHGSWVDADRNVSELQADIVAMLASSPTPEAEEWAIHDYDGFGGYEPGEYEQLETVSRVATGIAEHGEPFAAYVEWAGTSEEATQDFGNHYVGTYESAEAWARDVAEDQGWEHQLDEALGALVRPFVSIDYEAFAQQMAASENWQVIEGREGVHIFAP